MLYTYKNESTITNAIFEITFAGEGSYEIKNVSMRDLKFCLDVDESNKKRASLRLSFCPSDQGMTVKPGDTQTLNFDSDLLINQDEMKKEYVKNLVCEANQAKAQLKDLVEEMEEYSRIESLDIDCEDEYLETLASADKSFDEYAEGFLNTKPNEF